MDNISQEEIDALIDEAAEAEDGAAEAATEVPEAGPEPASFEASHDTGPQSYDFNRPHNLSRTFERTLRGICETYAKVATLSFSNLVRANCVFTFGGLKLASFGEAFAAVENPSGIAVVELAPLKGVSLVTVDAGAMFSLFTKLLGGPIEATKQIRDFTEIEVNLARKIMDRLLENFTASAEKVVDLSSQVNQIENNPNYLNVYADGETVVNLQYTIAIEELNGFLNFFLPLSAFEPVRDIFDPKEGMARPGQDPAERQRIEQAVNAVPATVSVRLASQDIGLDELTRLREDDVLPLAHAVGRPLDVMVEGDRMFQGTLGQVGQTRACRIVGRVKEI